MKSLDPSSEKGIALVVVLLLMVVLSGLATGFAMNGNVEVQMGANEVSFAGARAAAEAGLNRAIVEVIADTTTNLLAGQDGAVDAGNPAAAVNDDNGDIGFLIGSAGPYALGTSGEYTYIIEILDDDDPALYETALTDQQLTDMGEQVPANIYVNANDRLILRATGFGPKDTVVRIARVLETVDTLNTTTTTTTVLSNPAILVNGDFVMDGSVTVNGTSGSVHANGNLEKTGGSGTITGNATASGDYTGPAVATGSTGGGRPTINVPNIQASDYMSLADYKLTMVDGACGTACVPVVQTYSSSTSSWSTCFNYSTGAGTSACKGTGWSYSGGTWSSNGTPANATYYIDGNVDIGPTTGSTNRAVSVISTGSINIHGSAELTPENAEKIQFVADGDLVINGSVDLNDPTTVEGQIMVRGQFDAHGNMSFQGRVMVQDVQDVGNLVANGGNQISGSVTFTYNGTLGAISTTTTTSSSTTTYVNNVSGWMEQ